MNLQLGFMCEDAHGELSYATREFTEEQALELYLLLRQWKHYHRHKNKKVITRDWDYWHMESYFLVNDGDAEGIEITFKD